MKKLLFLLLVLFGGCDRKATLGEKELIAYVNDESNRLIRTVEYEDFKVVATYKPLDFIVRQQMEKGTAREIDSLRKAYSLYLYFSLAIEKNGKDLETAFASDLDTFPEKISYLTSDFSERISLAGSSDHLAIADYIYMRSFGTGPSQFLLVFKKPVDDDFDLVVEGYRLGFGKLRFPFERSDLENAPQLKL